MNNAWLFLLIAGLLEIVWAGLLKASDGFQHLIYSVAMVIAMILSFFFLGIALKSIPISVGYAIWTAIGTVGTVAVGSLIYGESLSPLKLFFLGLLLLSTIGLKVIS
ncbi:MAG: multidrug efflux SMR transporter [Oligoflexia bacterium]|nr:multidrug efflux SMR transporter [Oligoflexia bacterium]